MKTHTCWYRIRKFVNLYIIHERYPMNCLKLLTFLSVSVACFSFSGCKQKTNIYTIGISQCSDDEWRHKMNTEMLQEAALRQNVELIIKTAGDDTEKQINDIAGFIEQKVDLIIVAPNKAAPVTPIVEKAYYAGIPVVLVDRKILSDKYTAFIGADNYQIGKEVGNYAVNLLKGKGNIVELEGLDGSTPALERHQGFYSIICNYPNIHLICREDAAWLKEVAYVKMEKALKEFPKIDLVFAQNDRMASGAYNAAKAEGRIGETHFLGIDALPGENGGIDQVLSSKLDATFIYPTGGDKTIQLALNILEGKPFQKNNTLYTAVVDKTNARVLKLQSDQIIEQESKIDFLNERVDNYLSQYTTQRYLFYSACVIVLLFICLFVGFFVAYRSKNRLNIELSKRNKEINEQKNLSEKQRDQLIDLSKRLEEATHAKLVFFTNISHEFRTPLTLINGPVESLLTSSNTSSEQHRLLTLVQKNVAILMKLIDQIIDFRKYENGKLKLNLTKNNLRSEFSEWNRSFSEIAKKKQIRFEAEILSDSDFTFRYDPEKMERIYFNLLSNAFKFTSENGTIFVSLDSDITDEKQVAVIKVFNTGKGISEKDIQNIFDRFYQVDPGMAGSGIGLALVKALVELHDGQIRAESDENTGTTFSVRIPFTQVKQNDPHLSVESERSEYSSGVFPTFLAEQPENEDNVNTGDASRLTLLIVDDNRDIRSYIKNILQSKYNIVEAEDGESGIAQAKKYIPDIIVSDIMMPNTDGYGLCDKLKKEPSTSHIPIILLTACSLDEQRIEGFESGADAYIPKPFNPRVLEVRIRKMIENRKQLAAYFNKNLNFDKSPGNINPLDQKLLEKFKTYVTNNISDPDLNVEEIGRELGFSRVQLYRKIKAITNNAPNELVRIIRLKKSVELLTSGKTISEIAYEVGFSSPAYFTKCFKDYFNESPTESIKKETT